MMKRLINDKCHHLTCYKINLFHCDKVPREPQLPNKQRLENFHIFLTTYRSGNLFIAISFSYDLLN